MLQGINEKILSLNYKDYKAEIKTADAQKSYKEGVTVLVTGCLTGKDNLRRQFAQSFFLAPQDNGYFVLNDVFRYLDENEPSEQHSVNEVDDSTAVHITLDPGMINSKECFNFFGYRINWDCCHAFHVSLQSLVMFLIYLHQILQILM